MEASLRSLQPLSSITELLVTDDSAAAKSLTGGRGIPQVAAQGSVTELPGADYSASGDTKRVITPDTQDSDIKSPRIHIMMKPGA